MGLDSPGPPIGRGVSFCVSIGSKIERGPLNEQRRPNDDHLGRSISSLLGATRELNWIRGGIFQQEFVAIVYREVP